MSGQSWRIPLVLGAFWLSYLVYDLTTQRMGSGGPGSARSVIARRLAGGSVLAGVPALAALSLGMGLGEIGVRGSGPLSFAGAVAAVAILVPIMVLLSRSSRACRTYPLIRAPRWGLGLYAANACSWAFFLAGYETCFRGFLLMSLTRDLGEAPAIAIATVVYSAVHLRQGPEETLGSIPVGLAFAWLTLRTGTIWAAWLGHLLIACTTETACLARAGLLARRRRGRRRAAAALALLCLTAGPAAAQTIKLGTLAPPGSPWESGLRRLAAEWGRLSSGRVCLKVYAGGVVGDEDDMLRKIRLGQLGAAALSGPGLSAVVPSVLTLQVPQLVRTGDELDALMERMTPWFAERFEGRGFKLLSWTLAGWAYLFARDPVVRPDELRGQRLWVWQGRPEEAAAWRRLGFQPVTLASTDVLVQLQTGGVDAFISSPLVAAANQYFALADNMADLELAPFVGGLVVSLRAWSSIPEELRPVLESAARRMSALCRQELTGADAQAIAVMKSHGLTVHPVSAAARDEWRRFFMDAAPALLGSDFDPECYEAARRHLQALRLAGTGR